MHAEPLTGCAEVGRGPERVGADEHAAFRPPERDLPPAWEVKDPAKRERRSLDAGEWNDVKGHAELLGESGAVAVVAVEELYDARGASSRTNPIFEAVSGKRIDEPGAAVRDQHVGRPLEETRLFPPEPVLELVTGPEIHLRAHRTETRI